MSGFPFFDRSTAPPVQQVFDFTGSPDGVQPIYIGWSTPGSKIDSPVWMIRKFTYVSDGQGGYRVTNIQYANADVGYKYAWNTTPGSVIGSTFTNAAVLNFL